ncbi:T9SS type A sorting domain-containing protein [Psychroserpens sp. NJDZ02]|uniref:T9SS type A sorting domain-containing protein n=1 Tax=Psychroserpens sp. NJDZ02 TaxID=2570561 RepID=UPI0010A821C2|nr:T9SS type A sorting domain-containing protein [Psychroserpens sp. NJDZ02]QCE40030.1 T9SS type A sorting domain-containing protein [Psychroserpens sp. NJDZ02]
MKTKLLTLLLFITTFNLIGQINLVPNADMENWDSFDDNPDDWSRFLNGYWNKSSDAQNGTSSLELEIDSDRTFIYIFTPDIQFTSGTTYVCSFYYKKVSDNITKIEFNLMQTQSVFPVSLSDNEFTDLSATEWKKGEFEFTATDTENVQAWIYTRGDASAKALIDNVSIVNKATLSTAAFSDVKNKINIYPNPSQNQIKISGINTLEPYTIYNAIGKEISKGKVSKNEEIDIKAFSKGLYFLKLDNGNTLKFIKE